MKTRYDEFKKERLAHIEDRERQAEAIDDLHYCICRQCWRVYKKSQMSYHRRNLCSSNCNHMHRKQSGEEIKISNLDYLRMIHDLKNVFIPTLSDPPHSQRAACNRER